jgi:hypothetical protein
MLKSYESFFLNFTDLESIIIFKERRPLNEGTENEETQAACSKYTSSLRPHTLVA